MKFLIGFLMVALDLIFAIVGFTCLVIGAMMDDASIMKEYLVVIGWVGVGSGIGTGLAFIGAFLMLIDKP